MDGISPRDLPQPDQDVEFHFSDHVLNIRRRELRRGPAPIGVEPQVFDLLTYLLQNRDRVVGRDELISSVWRGRIVSDSTLASRINAVRKAVGDNGEDQRLIRTFARKGIRFVGAVRTRPLSDRPEPGGGDRAGEFAEPSRAGLPRTDQPAIAVLPFVNMSGEQDNEYLSDGITEDIITALSKVRWFLVTARNAAFACKGRSVQMKVIAEELGVGYLVGGSVRSSGDRVRITAQLSDVATGNQLWGERYDRRLGDMIAVQDEITEAIVAAVEPHVCAAESLRAQSKPPDHLGARDLVMRALSHFWRMTREDNVAAQAWLDQAIALEAGYAQALAVLSVSHTFGAHMGWEDPATAIPASEHLAQAAIRADGDESWAHFAVATGHISAGRFEDALATLEFALRLNPSFALARAHYGLALSSLGRRQEGAVAACRALRLGPRDPFAAVYNAIAAAREFAGYNYEEAIRLAREGIRQRPDFARAYRVLTAAAAMGGDMDLARATLGELRRVQPNISLAWLRGLVQIKDEAVRGRYFEAFRRAGLD